MNRLRSSVAVLFLAAASISCNWGYGPWLSPRGARVIATGASGAHYEGELLAVRDDGVLFLDGDVVRLARFGPGFDVWLRDPYHKAFRGSPNEKTRRSLAYYARYPGGLDPDRLDALLDAMGQDRLLRVR